MQSKPIIADQNEKLHNGEKQQGKIDAEGYDGKYDEPSSNPCSDQSPQILR
jgi:hypothetical protein